MQTLPSFLITQCVTDLVQIRSQPCQVPGAGGQWPNQDGDCHGGFCHHHAHPPDSPEQISRKKTV